MTTATQSKTEAKVISKVELSAKGVKALQAFNKAKEAEAKVKATKAKAEAILRTELGETPNTQATIQGVVVASVVGSKNTSFDRDALKEFLGEEKYNEFLKTTEYTYIKTAN
jgi:hypothetical protein